MNTIVLLAALVIGQASVEWKASPTNPDWVGLFHDGRQIGGVDRKTGVFRSYDGACDCWGEPQRLLDAIPNYGVDQSKLAEQEVYRINGKTVSKTMAEQTLSRDAIPDDAEALCLTIIGPEEARRRVMSDLQSANGLAPWRGKLRVQDYPPDHWAVREGFFTGGKPTIYLQRADGRVLHRQDEYLGPDDLATALRRADPKYDPKRDPDLRSLFAGPFKTLAQVPRPVWILGLGTLFLFLRKERS